MYEHNEASKVDWEGTIRVPTDWNNQAVIIDEIEGKLDEMANVVSTMEKMSIDKVI